MTTANNHVPTPTEVVEASIRLREFIRDHLHGRCRIFSQGSECKCALCDFDRIREAAYALRGQL